MLNNSSLILYASTLDFQFSKTVAFFKTLIEFFGFILEIASLNSLEGRNWLNCDETWRFSSPFFAPPSLSIPHFLIRAQFDLTWFDLSPATFSLNKVTKSYLLGETRALPDGRVWWIFTLLKNSNFALFKCNAWRQRTSIWWGVWDVNASPLICPAKEGARRRNYPIWIDSKRASLCEWVLLHCFDGGSWTVMSPEGGDLWIR